MVYKYYCGLCSAQTDLVIFYGYLFMDKINIFRIFYIFYKLHFGISFFMATNVNIIFLAVITISKLFNLLKDIVIVFFLFNSHFGTMYLEFKTIIYIFIDFVR